MPEEQRVYTQWRNANENVKYPFSTRATLTNDEVSITPEIFIDARLYPVGGTETLHLSRITKTSTNLEIALTCSVRGKLEQQGEYTVPSKLFYEFVNLLPDDVVNMDLHDDGLFVSCAKAKTTINGISPAEFPLIPPVEGEVKFEVGVTELKKALAQTLFATAMNEARPELTGVYMKFKDGKLTMAATDSYRLSEVQLKAPSQDQEYEVIVPQRTLSELNRVFSVFKDDVEASQSVTMELANNQVVFHYASVDLFPEQSKECIQTTDKSFQRSTKQK